MVISGTQGPIYFIHYPDLILDQIYIETYVGLRSLLFFTTLGECLRVRILCYKG